MNAYSFFKYFHSGFRYFVIIVVLLAIISAFAGWFGKKQYTEANRKNNMIAMILFHTQVFLGLVLYFISPNVKFSAGVMKDPALRYFTAEHITMMLIAMALITIGHSKSKKAALPEAKHKSIAIFYSLTLLIVVVAIALMTKDVPGHTFFGITQ